MLEVFSSRAQRGRPSSLGRLRSFTVSTHRRADLAIASKKQMAFARTPCAFLSWPFSMPPTGARHHSLGSVHKRTRPGTRNAKWQLFFIAITTSCGLHLQPCDSRESGSPEDSTPRMAAHTRYQVVLPYEQQHNNTNDVSSPVSRSPNERPESEHPLRRSRPATSHRRQKRVVLSYQLQGCPSKRKGAEEGQLLQGQEASNQTMKLLRDKLSELIAAKKLKWAEAVTPASEILGYAQQSGSKRLTTEVSSRYLSSLQMEVIKTLPPEVSEEEVIEVAQALPCVEKAYPDGLKFSEATLGGSEEDSTPTPLQKEDSNVGLDRKLSLDFLSGGVENLDDHTWPGPPNDPGFRVQWSLHDSAPFSLHAEKLWRIWTGEKRPMVIAVIDSGCDMQHPDLKSRAWNNPGEICDDGIDNDENGLIDDCHGWNFAEDVPDTSGSADGHGTGAAGILGATARNRIGLVGVCWGCEIMCLKFIGKGKGAISDQVQAIDYAVKMGAWISNNSYGGYGYSELEFDAIRRAQIGGHLFITSAGNFNLNTDLPQNDHTPSTYKLSNIVSVGASTYAGKKAAFSNYGQKTVHVFAPGAGVYTTDGVSGYAKVNGTSFASPHVAGAAGLIWSAFPSLTYLQIKQALIEGCTKSRHLGPFAVCGGTVDLVASFRFCAELAARTNSASPVPKLRRGPQPSASFDPNEQNASKARALPAREPEVLSVLGISHGVALNKPMDVYSQQTPDQRDVAVAPGKSATDSSLGPAVSAPAYRKETNAGATQGIPFDTFAASEAFRRCADTMPVPSDEGSKTIGDCGFLFKILSLAPDVPRERSGSAMNGTFPLTSVPSSFSLFNDTRLEQVWRAKTQS